MNDLNSTLWLPGHALNCYEGSAAMRSWLLTPGLLTERIREQAGERFRMHVVREQPAPDRGHLREIAMSCGDELWMFARSDVPAATLARHPWIARLGVTPLGEALRARDLRVARSEFVFARLTNADPLVAAALEFAGREHDALWVRRSTFELDGEPFWLRELFLPEIGRNTPA